ncbi:MAG: hypothetical protein ACRDG4_17745 [Chloroflexota bacterium]
MSSPPVPAAPPTFAMAATLEERANLLARRIAPIDGGAVVFASNPIAIRAALEHALPGVRVLALETPSDAAEWSLRLAEVTAGVHRVAAIDPRLLWDSQVILALGRWAPRLIGVELVGIGSVGLYDPWAANLLLKRVRRILPTAALTLVSVPMGAESRARLERLVGTQAVAHGGVAPGGVAFQVMQVHTERRRWRKLLDVASAYDAPTVVVAPTRARAASAAARLGASAMPYHGGLLESERASALEAFQRRNLRVLVTTQLLPTFENLPAPALIVLTHPPHHGELVPRLAAWLARGAVPGPLCILWNGSDAAAEGGDGLGARPNLADLRWAFRAVRALARNGYARLTPESLAEVAGHTVGQPYLAAMCLAALETAGYLRREDDIGRLVSVTVSAHDPVPTAASTLPPWQAGEPITMDPLVVAMRQGIEPNSWQRGLLDAALGGLLTYRPAGRERLYKLRDADRDTASRLQSMVQEWATVVGNDHRAVTRWLQGRTCRVRSLARLLDLPPEPECGRCDQCAPEASERAPVVGEPWHVVLRALAEIPPAVPERAAERIAGHALAGLGLESDSAGRKAIIELLVAEGLVRREVGDLQPRLAVSNEGWVRLAPPGRK